MRELLFFNPIQHPGLNLTVRNGTRWADARPGDLLDLIGTNTGESVGHAIIADAVMSSDIDRIEPLLSFEHDPDCRTVEGLRKALDEAYPEGWGPVVTLLFYVVVPRP